MMKILLPPGIGDGYWVAVKLADFMRREGVERPTVYVDGAPPQRSEGMWRRVPFVEWGGYVDMTELRKHPAFRRAYYHRGYTVQRDIMGFDYFISLNGALRNGLSLDQALPGIIADWYLRLLDSDEEGAARQRFAARRPYVLATFWDRGNYSHWLHDFPETKVVQTLDLIQAAGHEVVVMGAKYDRGTIAERLATRYIDMLGDTSFDEMMALIACSRGVFGFPAGNSLLGPYHRRPTLLLWNRYFHRRMWENCTPPGGTHIAADTRGADPRAVADCFLAMLE